MSDETGTTSEVARVLGEHYPDQTSYDAGDLQGCMCGWQVPAPRTYGESDWAAYYAHQAAMLAEAGLLRPQIATPVPADCGSCAACDPGLILDGKPTGFPSRMSGCPDCGNKRCPKGANHAKWECSGSNAVGQEGVPAPAVATRDGSVGRGGSGGLDGPQIVVEFTADTSKFTIGMLRHQVALLKRQLDQANTARTFAQRAAGRERAQVERVRALADELDADLTGIESTQRAAQRIRDAIDGPEHETNDAEEQR